MVQRSYPRKAGTKHLHSRRIRSRFDKKRYRFIKIVEASKNYGLRKTSLPLERRLQIGKYRWRIWYVVIYGGVFFFFFSQRWKTIFAGVVVGWGFNENGIVTNKLVRSLMPLVPLEVCVNNYPGFYQHFTTGKSYCANFDNGKWEYSVKVTY